MVRKEWAFFLVAATVTAWLLTVPSPAAAHQHESWYSDLHSHWARPYVEILWEEGVTDGFRVRVIGIYAYWTTKYYPERDMLNDAWLTLLARVFDLEPRNDVRVFTDIQRPHRLAGGQEVFGLLQAAGLEGFKPGPRLRPGDSLSREEAVAALIRSLGLEGHAAGLSSAAVTSALAPFRDAHTITRGLRPLVALAVSLGIVEGYPDGTLKPLDALKRSEASALVVRSALIRALALPNPFSPDGDSFEDETVIGLTGLKNRNLSRWYLYITDRAGRQVWSVRSVSSTLALPRDVTWTGRRDDGRTLPEGTYYYQAVLRDTLGQEFASVTMPLVLMYRGLEAEIDPATAAPEAPVTVTAYTRGDAREVDFTFLGETAELKPAGTWAEGRIWRETVQVPPGTTAGAYPVEVLAHFPGVDRQVVLWLNVRESLVMTGWLEPDPVLPGDELTLWARREAGTALDRVEAVFEDGTVVDLHPAEFPDHWTGSYSVPREAEPRGYTVQITGHSAAEKASERLSYTVAGSALADIVVVLTD